MTKKPIKSDKNGIFDLAKIMTEENKDKRLHRGFKLKTYALSTTDASTCADEVLYTVKVEGCKSPIFSTVEATPGGIALRVNGGNGSEEEYAGADLLVAAGKCDAAQQQPVIEAFVG